MPATDQRAYNEVLRRPLKTTFAALLARGGTRFQVEMGLTLRRHVCARAAGKLAALRADLQRQRGSGGGAVHAVVFTAFADVHAAVAEALRADGHQVKREAEQGRGGS